MKLQFQEIDGSTIELNIGGVTQLFGRNGERKDKLIKTIAKYFSKYKYSEKELTDLNDNISPILIDDEVITRGYYKTMLINTIIDIEAELISNKNTLIYNYITNKIEKFEISNSINKLNTDIVFLLEEIRKEINISHILVNFDYEMFDIAKLLKTNTTINVSDESYCYIQNLKNINKIMGFLDLLIYEKYSNMLIIINNIDTYITKEEYRDIIKKMIEINSKKDISFIVSTSKVGYNYIDEKNIENINIVNDFIYTFPNIEVVTKYINNNYPYDKVFHSEDIIKMLEEIIHHIGEETKLIEIQSNILLKLINSSEDILTDGIKRPNDLELNYIQK